MTVRLNTPEFKLNLGTLDFSSESLKGRVVEIDVNQVSDGPSSFKVSLDDTANYFSEDSKIKEGDSASVEFGYQGGSPVKVIEGLITGISVEQFGSKKRLIIKGYDGMQALTRGKKRRSWEKIKDSDIASTIAGEAGLGCDAEDSGIVHPYVAQNNMTNLAFLQERAKRIGFEVSVKDKKLCFKAPQIQDSVCTLSLSAKKVDEDASIIPITKFNVSSSTMGVVDEVVVRSYDPKTAKAIVASSKDITSGTMGGKKTGADYAKANNPSTSIQISDENVYSTEEAEKLAKAVLNQRAANFITGRGACEGDGRIQCGKVITLDSIGADMNGDYYVRASRHFYRAGKGYTVSFEVSRSGR